jgi:hypothetical protein
MFKKKLNFQKHNYNSQPIKMFNFNTFTDQ